MVADVGFDPGYNGLLTYEATDLLLRRRKILKDVHVVIWQVGCVGDIGFRHQGFHNDSISVLIEYLQGVYGADYMITHYIGAQYAFADPIVEKFKLSELLLPENKRKIIGISTFYIPPAENLPTDFQLANRIGRNATQKIDGHSLIDPEWIYNKPINNVIASMRTFSIPKAYKTVYVGSFSDLLLRFAFDHKAMQQYRVNPELFHTKYPISSFEQDAMLNKNMLYTTLCLRTSNSDPSRRAAIRILDDNDFATKYREALTEQADEWLAQQGYNGAAAEMVNGLISNNATQVVVVISIVGWSIVTVIATKGEEDDA